MKYIALIIILVMGFSNLLFSQSKKDYVRRGNEFYKESRYDSATANYENAYLKDTSYIKGLYNNALSLYKQSKYDESIAKLNQLIEKEKDTQLLSKAYYNMGNAYFMKAYSTIQNSLSQPNEVNPQVYQSIMMELQNSLEAYKSSLRYNPYDNDTKHNYSFVANLLKQAQNQQNQGQNSGKGNNQQQQENQGNQNNQSDNQQGNQQNKGQDGKGQSQQDENKQSWTDKLSNQGQKQQDKQQQNQGNSNKSDKSLSDKMFNDQQNTQQQGKDNENQNKSWTDKMNEDKREESGNQNSKSTDKKHNQPNEKNSESLLDKLMQAQNTKQEQNKDYSNVRNKLTQEDKLNQQNQLKHKDMDNHDKLRVINLLNNDEKKIQKKLKKKQGILIKGKKDW
jgi:tetratricopeptide (TPR) repeat protein